MEASDLLLPFGIIVSILVCILALYIIIKLIKNLFVYIRHEIRFLNGNNHDFEQGEGNLETGNNLSPSPQAALNQVAVQNESDTSETSDRHVAATEGNQGQQGLEILPPLLIYGSHIELESSSSNCAICLDDFVDGVLCRVFPVCNHMFHSDCIDPWLKDHPTCPVCRYSFKDV